MIILRVHNIEFQSTRINILPIIISYFVALQVMKKNFLLNKETTTYALRISKNCSIS